MHHLRSSQLRDMTACGAALRRLGTDATSLEQVADRLVRHLYRSLTMGHLREPACNLVRLFKTTPYSRLTPDLRALADTRLGDTPPPPSLTCLTLLASVGAVPGWNDSARSSRFRVIPLDTLEAVERLPMFSQLFRQLGVSLPSLTQPGPSVLLDQHEQSFNVFHIPEAEGSPYVPGQEEFVFKYGIRSVLGFGAPLPDGELFSIILFSKDFIPESTATLFKPLALCAQIALAPYANTTATSHPHHTSMPERVGSDPTPVHDAHLQARIADLERLLAVHEQTVEEQADRMELIVPGSQMGTWDWEIPTGRVTFNERWASMLGYRLDELEPHVRTWEQLVHPDDLHQVMATVSAHLRGDTPTYSSEHRLRTKSGAWCWVFDSGRVVERNAKGAPLRVAGIHLDISEQKRMEESLRESEERFRQVTEHIDAVFWLTSPDKSQVLYVSPAFETVWECPRDLLYANPGLWFDHVHPEDRNRVTATACQPCDEEYRIVTPGGRVRWIRDRSFAIKNATGETYRLAGIAGDITDAKQMEDNLRASERRHRSLVELSPHAIFINCEDRIVFANRACAKLLGAIAPSQLFGKRVLEIIHPGSQDLVQERIASIRATNQAAPPIEEQFIALDGSVIEVEVAAAPIMFEGKPAIQVIATDIRARKGLERALLATNLQLQTILASATTVSIVATNTEGTITTFNTGAEELLGYSAVEMIGHQSLTLLHVPEEIDRHARELSDLYEHPIHGVAALIENAKRGGFDEREWTYQRKDGSRLTVLSTITALRDSDGVVTGFLAIGKDITSRKAAENALAQARDEALRAAQIKADFLATMSHEIRTPMNAIIGMTGLLLDTALTKEQHEFADSVRRSSDGLLTLLNDILDFSKIEAGKLHFEQLPFDLRMTVEDTVELLAEQAQSKGLELIGLVDAAVPTAVVGDPGRLRQILVNLVGNAIKFTAAGEVFLHVTRETQDGLDLLRFTIKDTGIGIPEAVQGRLFHAFVQADSSTTRRFGGTGLGLAICQRLVSQMHGRIGVESHSGQGSTFWFTAQFPETTLATPPSPFSWSRLRGRGILLVDHCDTVRQALRQELTSHGMNCTVARSGPEAVELARAAAAAHNPFDLALIELHLSDVDGFETATLLKQDPATAGIRLVILTTVGRRGDGQTARSIGIDAYLTKPLRQTQLLECLCLLLDQQATAGAPANAEPPPLITRHTLSESQAGPKPRLLLAEDNPVNQKVACKMLEKLGYRVDVAGNGQEAVAAHERSRYPLIFMDCQMPEVDGFEATALIRKMEGRSAHTPIVAMTANAMQGDRERCLAAGMDDYVAKPIRPKDLQAILDTWLHKRNQAAAS